MTTYNTGNPIGSKDPRDLYDNAENLDTAVNDTSRDTWTDRLGRSRKTMSGMEREFNVEQALREHRFNTFLESSGYQFLGDYAAGIEVTEYNQIVRDSNGEFWRVSGQVELPYTTTGAGLPENGAFVSVGDAVLRQDLANPDMGAAMVGYGGGTVADKLGLTVSVWDFGAKGDGVEDDTDSIQSAIDKVALEGGGTVHVPPGVYMIKGHVPGTPKTTYLGDEGGIELKDNVHLKLDINATLRAIPNSERAYNIVRIYNKTNVMVEGGTIQGEREHHNGATGEWGYGISISGGSNIKIKDVRTIDCWGDGINLQYARVNSVFINPTDVWIENVTSINNRRQGMSVESLVNGYIINSEFAETNGIAPSTGVDIEPANPGATVKNVRFIGCLFRDNASSGMLVMGSNVNSVFVDSCTFINNKDSEAQFKTYSGANNISVNNCYFEVQDRSTRGIYFQDGSDFSAKGNVLINCRIGIRSHNRPVSRVQIWDNYVRFTLPTFTSFEMIETVSISSVEIANNTFDFSENDENAEQFVLRGSDIRFEQNTLLGGRYGVGVDAPYAIVRGNKIHGSGIRAARLNAPGVIFEDNIISGACHSNNGQPAVIVTELANGSVIKNNSFYRESFIPVPGTGVASVALSLDSSLTWLHVSGNTTHTEDKGSHFRLINFPGRPKSPTNYLAIAGIPRGPADERYIGAQIGDAHFDTDTGKPIWCKSVAVYDSDGTVTTPAVWVDADGVEV